MPEAIFTKLTKTNSYVWGLLFVWVAVQVLLFLKNGLVTVGEPSKYISEAALFESTGRFSSPNFWLYSTLIFLIIAGLKLKIGFSLAVFVQLGLSFLATISIYRFSCKFFSPVTALVGTMLFILNYPLQEFNTYLQTESIFFSLTIIFSTYLLQSPALTGKHVIAIILLLALISVTRPTGILYIPAVLAYLIFRFFRAYNKWLKFLFVVIVSILFLFVLNRALGSGGELDFMLPHLRENIICGVNTLPANAKIAIASDGNSLQGLIYYVAHNPGHFAGLAFQRTIAFFGLLRSYYSVGHNLFLGIFFYPVYLLAILSLRWWIKHDPALLLYLSFLVALTWGTVMVTCDDWHNRFFLSVSTYLLILGLPFLNSLFQKQKADPV